MSSWGRRWRTADWDASSATRTTAGEPASASASWRGSRRYRSTHDAAGVASSSAPAVASPSHARPRPGGLRLPLDDRAGAAAREDGKPRRQDEGHGRPRHQEALPELRGATGHDAGWKRSYAGLPG